MYLNAKLLAKLAQKINSTAGKVFQIHSILKLNFYS